MSSVQLSHYFQVNSIRVFSCSHFGYFCKLDSALFRPHTVIVRLMTSIAHAAWSLILHSGYTLQTQIHDGMLFQHTYNIVLFCNSFPLLLLRIASSTSWLSFRFKWCKTLHWVNLHFPFNITYTRFHFSDSLAWISSSSLVLRNFLAGNV